jgi:lysine biosynthesis protein LysW
MKIICPDCQNDIKNDGNLLIGDIVECQECGTEVEITSIEPLTYRVLIEENKRKTPSLKNSLLLIFSVPITTPFVFLLL